MQFKKEFDYTGDIQSFVVPRTGFYLLEAWGAQGGNTFGPESNQNFTGGYGAFSTGVVLLKSSETIYVAVGEEGKTNKFSYNGGGKDRPLSSCKTQTASGGGCTHFAYRPGELKTLNKSQYTVLLVASGGGGSFVRKCPRFEGLMNGGHGGGKKGSSPVFVYKKAYSDVIPTGGDQERGGISSIEQNGTNVDSSTESYTGFFGQGGYECTGDVWSGGGGGWYGGAVGYSRAGAGGSGFLSNYLISYQKKKKHMSCFNCETSDSPNDYTISIDSCNANPVPDKAKLGNGYARVTLLRSYVSCKRTRNNLDLSLLANIIILSSK